MRKLLCALTTLADGCAERRPILPPRHGDRSHGRRTDRHHRRIMARAQQILARHQHRYVGGHRHLVTVACACDPDGYTIGRGVKPYVVNQSYPYLYTLSTRAVSMLAHGRVIMSCNSLRPRTWPSYYVAKATLQRNVRHGGLASPPHITGRCARRHRNKSSSAFPRGGARHAGRCSVPLDITSIRPVLLRRESGQRARLCGDGETASRLRAGYSDRR